MRRHTKKNGQQIVDTLDSRSRLNDTCRMTRWSSFSLRVYFMTHRSTRKRAVRWRRDKIVGTTNVNCRGERTLSIGMTSRDDHRFRWKRTTTSTYDDETSLVPIMDTTIDERHSADGTTCVRRNVSHAEHVSRCVRDNFSGSLTNRIMTHLTCIARCDVETRPTKYDHLVRMSTIVHRFDRCRQWPWFNVVST
jgi:hypothetical protein